MARWFQVTGAALVLTLLAPRVEAMDAALTLSSDSTCLEVGQQLVVTVSMSSAPITVCVGQFFLAYDADALDYVGMVPAPGTPFTLPFGPTVNEPAGFIDYAFAPPFGSCNGATSGPAEIAVITFNVLGACSPRLRFRPHDPPAKLADSEPQTVYPHLIDLPYITVDEGLPPALLCPADMLLTSEIGTAHAIATWFDPMDACGVAPPESACAPASGSTFPIGTTQVTCQAEGPCGATECRFDVEVMPPAGPPFIVHGLGREGQTRPFSGHIDPRAESTNGLDPDMGLDAVEVLFSEPVRAVGGATLSAASFAVSTTGGAAPSIAGVDASANPRVIVHFAPNVPPPLREWTTIIALVEDLNAEVIDSSGADLGPGVLEPDRIDVAFLPCDVDGNGRVQPADLIRFRQMYAGDPPERGIVTDYLDMNRGGTVTPADLIRLRQLLAGTLPATRAWLGADLINDQP